jgi:hypothetical protein
MSMNKPLEALLRPPLEWYSALAAITSILLLIRYSSLFLIPAGFAHVAIPTLAAFSLVRLKQGYRIFRYQRNLKRMPTYRMTSKQIPVNNHKL